MFSILKYLCCSCPCCCGACCCGQISLITGARVVFLLNIALAFFSLIYIAFSISSPIVIVAGKDQRSIVLFSKLSKNNLQLYCLASWH